MNQNNILKRHYQRHKITIKCKVITPMFLGNANQEAEWRAAPFKALLRYWWRVSQPNLFTNQLRDNEGEIFGSVSYTSGGRASKSYINVKINSFNNNPISEIFNVNSQIKHPEVDRREGMIPSLLYLAGMGLMQPKGQVNHSYFPPGSTFEWELEQPKGDSSLDTTLALIRAFGALGARCRNGWGSFQFASLSSIEEEIRLLNNITIDWEKGFKKDYPNCLGKDDNENPLIWKTQNSSPTWEQCMHRLAEIYVQVRTSLDADDQDRPGERHLLGFPITNHPASSQDYKGWGAEARHASPLRLFVRKRPEGFVGFILHLPFAHSRQMPLPPEINQLAVWQKVHQQLDKLMTRARYQDCLV